MAPGADIDLDAPFKEDIILEVRRSRMKMMPGLTIQSGIDKTIYCSSHYPQWQAEYPEAASRFKPGGFGENLVTASMNERNVCVGDIISAGDPDSGLLLQVSLPRQPCFKLNHRFHLKNFAPKTYAASRTGWYYRVLRPGPLEAGMSIALVERKHPKWTIERLQEYLHRNQTDDAMNEELSQIEELGQEARGAFVKRVAKAKAAANKKQQQSSESWADYKLVEKTRQTARITSFVLERVAPDPDAPSYLLGAHARLRLPGGLVRSYSIVSGTPNRFELGVALEDSSRGGSAYLHGTAAVGDVLPVAASITSAIAPAGKASAHVFIAGGVGITAFMALLDMYRKIHWDSVVHYAVRSKDDVPFAERLAALTGPAPAAADKSKGTAATEDEGEASSVKIVYYDKAQGQRLDIAQVMSSLPWNSQVYVCGPPGMMAEAQRAAGSAGLGEDEVHYEAFAADTGGDPFEVVVANRGGQQTPAPVLQVGGEETLLEALRRHFGADDSAIASSCEVGNCGTCKVVLKSGRVDHRGTALMENEKKDGMLSCWGLTSLMFSFDQTSPEYGCADKAGPRDTVDQARGAVYVATMDGVRAEALRRRGGGRQVRFVHTWKRLTVGW
ncbi:hypothetical protein JX266_004037 [Neoarthrinium moseri]|nr:hypothetical protein JX266_004037 [Neoarthrinium moseri]